MPIVPRAAPRVLIRWCSNSAYSGIWRESCSNEVVRMKIRRIMKPPRASTITTSANQEDKPFFSSHHNAGVKRIARVAARKMGASTSLEYFRPNTTITMAAAASNGRMTGEPRTIMDFMVNFSLFGMMYVRAKSIDFDNNTRFLPSAVEVDVQMRQREAF